MTDEDVAWAALLYVLRLPMRKKGRYNIQINGLDKLSGRDSGQRIDTYWRRGEEDGRDEKEPGKAGLGI